MAGRHRRPPAWRRLLRSALGGRAGVRPARAAALHAEVIGLRATVTALRRDLDLALARSAELAARLAADAAVTVEAAAPPVSLELPLLRLALTRVAEPPLTREMAIALSAPDRGEDTVRVEIVLADLPERSLLDPLTDRGSDLQDLRDLAAEIAAAPETVRRSA